MTVGSGISPDLLTLVFTGGITHPENTKRSRARTARAVHTAGGEFHPAPRTCPTNL